jgi:hypothetical protein
MACSVTAILLGCAAAAAVPLFYSPSSSGGAVPVHTFGPGAAAASTPAAGLPAAGAPVPTVPVPSVPVPSGPVSSAPVPTAAAPPSGASPGGAGPSAALPVGIRISGTGIAAPVVPVGVDQRGDLAIPERVDTVGWYRFGPAPGAPAGSIVLVGHVDSAQQGEGAFFTLHTVRPGAIVSVTGLRGQVFGYRVVSLQEYPKSSVPLDALFARGGAPHLTLITCGGSFDPAVRSYRDNIVVTAVPIGAAG